MKVVLAFLGLAACAPMPPVDAPATEVSCSIDGLGDAVGKPYSAQSAELLKSRSGSKTMRVIRPGMAVTMDYRVDRLNIELDARNIVTRVNCG